jgi:beta-glucanase (GH16 family)
MKRQYLFIILFVATVFSACAADRGTAAYDIGDQLKPVSTMQLVWADEFNTGTSVDTADWTFEKGYVRNGEIQYYTENRPENCRIENGELVITGRQETTPYEGTASFTSASIITNKKHSWQYGRFEIRAKVPAGKGPWPAFWAKGDNQNAGAGWPKCGEIDIMEYAGKNPNIMLQNAIYGTGSAPGQVQQQTKRVQAAEAYSEDYHIYSLDWTSKQLTFAIDNKVTAVVDLASVTPNPFNQKFFILLNLALGASTERTLGGKLDPSCLPVEFKVDYVRIYQKNTICLWGTTDVRYPQPDVPNIKTTTNLSLKAWKGERVNAQAVLSTNKDLSDVTVSMSDLTNGASVISASAVKTNFVGYVMTDELNKDGKGACGHRPNKAEWDSSMVADILDSAKVIDIQANTTQPVWVNVWVPADAKPGNYNGTLTVSGKNLSPVTLNMEIEVLNRTLPAPKDWAVHVDLWQNPYAVARYYQVPLWSQAHFDAMRPVMKMLADASQKVITATIMHKPWNGQTEDAFDSMVGKTKKRDGSWSYDYTVFDKWVEFMQSVGIDTQINCYTIIPWALNFDYMDQATGRVLYIKAKPGDAAYNEYWGSFLADFAKHLRQKGWFEKTTIAMDERGLDAMQEAIKLIRQVDPNFKISLAGNYHPEIETELYDYCVAVGQKFPAAVKAERDNAGKVSTVYNCCTEPRPNTFTFSPPAEATWIGWFAQAGHFDGYLRWSYNSWTIDPLRDSRFRTWAAGDCYIVYPGRSSIRMERLIEGIQDYEKISLLKKEFTKTNNKTKLEKLNKLISQFTIEELNKRGANEMVEQARKALNNF